MSFDQLVRISRFIATFACTTGPVKGRAIFLVGCGTSLLAIIITCLYTRHVKWKFAHLHMRRSILMVAGIRVIHFLRRGFEGVRTVSLSYKTRLATSASRIARYAGLLIVIQTSVNCVFVTHVDARVANQLEPAHTHTASRGAGRAVPLVSI
jgi:hypothetical protein